MNIETLADKINEAVAKDRDKYRFSHLQQFRTEIGRNRQALNKIFTGQTIFPEGRGDYAFHTGARGHGELQFNIGLEERHDRERWWRHGVAFSFERSRSFHAPQELQPKVLRFNAWLRSNTDALRDFLMWDWVGKKPKSKRSQDRQPEEIYPDSIEAEAFVFLGALVREPMVDVDQILRDFDRLYPLYQFVESGGESLGELPANELPQHGPKTATHTTASRSATEIEVYFRHLWLQDSLVRMLSVEFPGCRIHREYSKVEDGRVDVAVETPDGFLFCEIKVASHVRAARRQAIGQLMEYAHWPDNCRAKKWWILSEADPSPDDIAYIKSLRTRYALPVFYRRIDANATVLGPEI